MKANTKFILCVCANPSVDTFVYIDNFLTGKVNRAHQEQHFPGGKGVHVALAVAELGVPVKLLGFWAGPTGTWIKEQCQARGIECLGPTVKGWTRFCLTLRSSGNYNETELLGCGPEIGSKDNQSFFDMLRREAQQADCVSLSGSWPPSTEPNSYLDAFEIVQGFGVKTFIDLTGPAVDGIIPQEPYFIHMNHNESKACLSESDPSKAARTLSQNCAFAVVTKGEEGAYVAHKEELIHLSCPVETALSSVGSGDCFLAGFMVGYNLNQTWREAAWLATAAGAANCLRPELGMLHKKDIDRLLSQVQEEIIR